MPFPVYTPYAPLLLQACYDNYIVMVRRPQADRRSSQVGQKGPRCRHCSANAEAGAPVDAVLVPESRCALAPEAQARLSISLADKQFPARRNCTCRLEALEQLDTCWRSERMN
jgi:hypothetical protein